MLEAVNLTKIYKTKGSAPTKALDDVSIRFPETGMVFLLGKSGSGKSTLLNVCGGLDSPTKGEIIVNGRSSKDFSQSDFDSYRNTLIGFVFQEYNILNEFSVENNIALALQLQGKRKNKKAIKQLLQDVDLVGFEKRKPNTLSGGQKQRIAIARALVKEPKIIMADEPTGALDSNTGIQVFDTLKKLSKDKLVIVVSHDRDFAEKYADRIIELKDGKILSDVTKKLTEPQYVNDNIQLIGSDTISIKNNKSLTEKDYEYIRTFLSKNETTIISSNRQEIIEYKKASHITEDGNKEYFEDTDEKEIPKNECDPKKQKFIRSKLPIRHAFKIGASGLKSKPIRLVFTIFLCTFSFIMFGVASTMMLFNEKQVLCKTMEDCGYKVLPIVKYYDDYGTKNMTNADVTKLTKTFGEETFGANRKYTELKKCDGYDYEYNCYINVNSITNNEEYYNSSRINYVAYLPENHAFRKNRAKLGNYPQKNDEIWISSYTASVLIKNGFESVTGEEDLIGKELLLNIDNNLETYVISGIFDSDDEELSKKYSKYKEVVKTPTNEKELSQQEKELENLYDEISNGYHLVAFFSQKTFKNIVGKDFTDEPYNRVLVPYKSANKNAILTISSSRYATKGTRYMIYNSPAQNVYRFSEMINSLLKYFIIFGIVLAVFSMLLLSNFIVISISYKKKEVGILRAIGARGADVFKIFFAESFIIACISILLSTLGSIYVCNFLNGSVASSILGVSLFVFDTPSFIIMTAIALFTSFIATLLPVNSAAKKKPVDAIRSL